MPTTSIGPEGPGHRLDRLDHLRAAAAILVLSWHGVSSTLFPRAGVLSILCEGHTGVSLFCVISGFIFAYIYFDREVNYGRFITRRLFRIAPMLILYMAISFYSSEMTPADLLAVFTTTIKYGRGLTPFSAQDWTLLIEAQFYLLFPFLIAFTRDHGVKYLFGWLLLAILVRLSLYGYLGSVQGQAYWTILGRIDQFLVGMIGGVALRRGALASIPARAAAAAMGLAGLAAIVLFFWWWRDLTGGLFGALGNSWSFKNSLWVLIPTVEAVCYGAILVGYVAAPWRGPALLRPLGAAGAFLGRISYSIYMNQLLVIMWFAPLVHRFAPPGWPGSGTDAVVALIFVILPLVTLVSTFTYYLIERPFLSLKERRRPS